MPAYKDKAKGREMLFWTKAEYLKFADAMMDKPLSYYAFEMLYWCGIREGELLALTPGDFDFEKQTVSISKSYQRIKGQDVITAPKTAKSNRVIQMPAFLCEEMENYIRSLYAVEPTDRIFAVTESYLHREMDRGAKEAGGKRIRIHDLRHPNVKPKTKDIYHCLLHMGTVNLLERTISYSIGLRLIYQAEPNMMFHTCGKDS